MPVVDTERNRLSSVLDRCRVGEILRKIRGLGVGGRRTLNIRVRVFERARGAAGTGGYVPVIVTCDRAGLSSDEGNLLVDAERSSCDQPDSIARREVTEQFSAVVVNAHTGADNDLVIEPGRFPCRTDPRSEAPLAARHRSLANTGGSIFVVTRR